MARDDDGDSTTSTKSVERLLAEKESLRRTVQEGTKALEDRDGRIAELEAELSKIKSDGSRSRRDTGMDEEGIRRAIREEVGAMEEERSKVYEERQRAAQEFLTKRNAWVEKAMSEFPDAKDRSGALHKRAMELFADPSMGLSKIQGGQLIPTSESAEYLAYSRAHLDVQKQQASSEEKSSAARFASAGGSSAAGSVGGRTELTDAEYLALSKEDRDKYQREEFERKGALPP